MMYGGMYERLRHHMRVHWPLIWATQFVEIALASLGVSLGAAVISCSLDVSRQSTPEVPLIIDGLVAVATLSVVVVGLRTLRFRRFPRHQVVLRGGQVGLTLLLAGHLIMMPPVVIAWGLFARIWAVAPKEDIASDLKDLDEIGLALDGWATCEEEMGCMVEGAVSGDPSECRHAVRGTFSVRSHRMGPWCVSPPYGLGVVRSLGSWMSTWEWIGTTSSEDAAGILSVVGHSYLGKPIEVAADDCYSASRIVDDARRCSARVDVVSCARERAIMVGEGRASVHCWSGGGWGASDTCALELVCDPKSAGGGLEDLAWVFYRLFRLESMQVGGARYVHAMQSLLLGWAVVVAVASAAALAVVAGLRGALLVLSGVIAGIVLIYSLCGSMGETLVPALVLLPLLLVSLLCVGLLVMARCGIVAYRGWYANAALGAWAVVPLVVWQALVDDEFFFNQQVLGALGAPGMEPRPMLLCALALSAATILVVLAIRALDRKLAVSPR